MPNGHLAEKRASQAGPRASSDPQIYSDTLGIIESAYYLGLARSGMPGARTADDPVSDTINLSSKRPQSIDEAVERLISQIPFKDKTTVANMSQDELPSLHLTLGDYILSNFGLLSDNHELLESCRLKADGAFQHAEDAVAIIIQALWEKLQQTHRLRVIK